MANQFLTIYSIHLKTYSWLSWTVDPDLRRQDIVFMCCSISHGHKMHAPLINVALYLCHLSMVLKYRKERNLNYFQCNLPFRQWHSNAFELVILFHVFLVLLIWSTCNIFFFFQDKFYNSSSPNRKRKYLSTYQHLPNA